jgi:hypothetical protein
MNPYIEQDDVWHSFHQQFCSVCLAILVPQVRPGYIVKLEEHVYIHELPAVERRLLGRADVSVSTTQTRTDNPTGTAVLIAPAYGRIPAAVDIERESFIEVRDRKTRELITVIELLSPSNKRPGPDREQYLAKRRQLFASPVHFVEIDLLRGGPQMPLEAFPGCDYYVLVSRAEDRPRVGVWPIGVRDPLPEIPVPLRTPDSDARIDLRKLLDRVYDDAGYEDYVYAGLPQPPLRMEDASWAEQYVPKLHPPV